MVARVRHAITHALHQGEEWIFRNPKIVLSLVLLVTCLFGTALPNLRVFTDFSDLLPQNHPYIKVYNRLKENFGGANMIVMAVEVEKGTIFNDETLKLIHEATQGVDNLPSVNHNLVSSLTHRTARKVCIADAYLFTVIGWTRFQNIDLAPWPAIAAYQQRVMARPAVQAAMQEEGLI